MREEDLSAFGVQVQIISSIQIALKFGAELLLNDKRQRVKYGMILTVKRRQLR